MITKKEISIVVIAASAIILVGKVLGLLDFMTTKIPSFTAALCILIAGAILFYTCSKSQSDTDDIMFAAATFLLLFITSSILASMLAEADSGIERLFVAGNEQELPSIGTIIALLIVSIVGIFRIFSVEGKILQIIIYTLLAISITAIIGHITGTPLLYYQLGISGPMEIGTAILLALLDVGFLR